MDLIDRLKNLSKQAAKIGGQLETEEAHKFIIVSVHFKAAGYIGSHEDDLRIQQATQLKGEIEKLRAGDFSDAIKDVPVVVIGDYNLVGSCTPLEPLETAGLDAILFRGPGDSSAYTWRGLEPDASFWPGRLDWAMHSEGIEPLKALVLDSERLSEQHLEQLGLQADDSRASDHLMPIGDFRILD